MLTDTEKYKQEMRGDFDTNENVNIISTPFGRQVYEKIKKQLKYNVIHTNTHNENNKVIDIDILINKTNKISESTIIHYIANKFVDYINNIPDKYIHTVNITEIYQNQSEKHKGLDKYTISYNCIYYNSVFEFEIDKIKKKIGYK